jgi:hypothetical protein
MPSFQQFFEYVRTHIHLAVSCRVSSCCTQVRCVTLPPHVTRQHAREHRSRSDVRCHSIVLMHTLPYTLTILNNLCIHHQFRLRGQI